MDFVWDWNESQEDGRWEMSEDHCLEYLEVRKQNRHGIACRTYPDVSKALRERGCHNHGCGGDDTRDEEDGSQFSFFDMVVRLEEVGNP